jgi:hypothetical protein
MFDLSAAFSGVTFSSPKRRHDQRTPGFPPEQAWHSPSITKVSDLSSIGLTWAVRSCARHLALSKQHAEVISRHLDCFGKIEALLFPQRLDLFQVSESPFGVLGAQGAIKSSIARRRVHALYRIGAVQVQEAGLAKGEPCTGEESRRDRPRRYVDEIEADDRFECGYAPRQFAYVKIKGLAHIGDLYSRQPSGDRSAASCVHIGGLPVQPLQCLSEMNHMLPGAARDLQHEPGFR